MSLAYYARNAATAERMRRKMRKEGVTLSGKKLWTEAEDEILRASYPNYRRMLKLLPHRTHQAVLMRCRKLGLKKFVRPWTAFEVSKLRKLYSSASIEEICAAFPVFCARISCQACAP